MPITRTLLTGLLMALSCRQSSAQVPDIDRAIVEANKDLRGEGDRLEPSPGLRIESSGIEFRVPPRVDRMPPQSISASRLRHVVPKKARQLVDRGLKFSERGQNARAHEELDAALALDAEYLEAHNVLGIVYAREMRLGDAEASFRRALALDAQSAAVHYNLGLLYLVAGLRPAAIDSARTVLSVAPADPRGHLLLGVLLSSVPEQRSEALDHLNAAARTLPEARRALKELTK